VGAGHVGREEVRRHLDPVVLKAGRLREEVRDRRLRDARHAFEDHVATSQQRDSQQLNDTFVSDEYAAGSPLDVVVQVARIRHVFP